MKKRTLSLLIAIVMCLSLCSIGGYAYSGETVSDESMKAFLQERGFSEEYLNRLIPQQVQAVYDKVYSTDSYLYSHKNYVASMEGSLIETKGNIPTRDLSFDVSITLSLTTRNNIVYIKQANVIVTYDWLNLPVYRNDDMISVNWDSSLLNYAGDNTFSSHDYYYVAYRWVELQHCSQPAVANQGGIGNYVMLAAQEMGGVGLKGDMTFSLQPKEEYSMTTSGGNNTTISAVYAHDKGRSSLSFSLTGSSTIGYGGGVSITLKSEDASLSASEVQKYGT